MKRGDTRTAGEWHETRRGQVHTPLQRNIDPISRFGARFATSSVLWGADHEREGEQGAVQINPPGTVPLRALQRAQRAIFPAEPDTNTEKDSRLKERMRKL